MKTTLSTRRSCGGYALMIVLSLAAVSIILLASTMYRTTNVARLNDRNNQYTVSLNAAEAATEKVIAQMSYYFQTVGLGGVTNNLGILRTLVPNSSESPYMSNFDFSDGQGNVNRTYVSYLTNYSGPLPSQYPGLFTLNSPVYRVLSNARMKTGVYGITNAVQEDVLLALVPITQYAIFYNSLLEFSTCATMTVNGRVHANASIYTGTSASLTFNGTVTATGTISSPARNGQGPSWANTGAFNGNPNYKTNIPTVSLSINMTNTHSLIDMPPAGEDPTSSQGQQRLYNQAQIVMLISNSTTVVTNTSVYVRIQSSVNGQVPGADPTAVPLLFPNLLAATSSLPFLNLSITNFVDQREASKTNVTTQIDLGKYAYWIAHNLSVLGKFPAGSGTYPTILFVADNRTTTASQQTAVRITNGVAPPSNGGLGFSLATPNPLYVWGTYNCANPSYLASTNTSATVPSALMSDALTILSSSWQDSKSSGSFGSRSAASSDTVNAAILTGIVPSIGSSSTQFSGGVHNLPRLLEDWSSSTLWLNTSIVNLFNSNRATNKFVNPGTYYNPPTRKFSFDINFLDPAKQPPGIPCALVLIRKNWAVPPPNNITYNVTP